jgi:tagatose-6-phosphate ketose/aldose isomerase
LDLIQEIHDKRLTRKCLLVSPEKLEKTDSFSTHALSFDLRKGTSDHYLPPLFVPVGQLLGLFASLKEGLKPDEPSPQGAITRVVSHVAIY